MSAVNNIWENPVKTPSRDEIIEEKLRHIVGRLERMETIGKNDYLKLDPVESTALAIVLKERIAEYTMRRYSTEREQTDMEMVRQQRMMAQRAAQAVQPGQFHAVLSSGSGGGGTGLNQVGAIHAVGQPVKKSWWKP